MVGQFSVEVNRKGEAGLSRGPLLPSSKPAKLRVFYSGTDTQNAFQLVEGVGLVVANPAERSGNDVELGPV
jgi:hypothetical protein